MEKERDFTAGFWKRLWRTIVSWVCGVGKAIGGFFAKLPFRIAAFAKYIWRGIKNYALGFVHGNWAVKLSYLFMGTGNIAAGQYIKGYRTIFVLTIAIPQFITLLTMNNFLHIDGPLNTLLLDWGLIDSRIDFLGSVANGAILPRISVLVVNLWIGVPYTMLITTGVLMNIPQDLFEAAKIDGANPVTLFARITLPYVLFVTGPYLIQQFIGNINNFNLIFLLSGGGPIVPEYHIAGKTDLLITWLYKLTIEQNDYNLGAVIGIYTFAASAIFSLLAYSKTSSAKREEDFQ